MSANRARQLVTLMDRSKRRERKQLIQLGGPRGVVGAHADDRRPRLGQLGADPLNQSENELSRSIRSGRIKGVNNEVTAFCRVRLPSKERDHISCCTKLHP